MIGSSRSYAIGMAHFQLAGGWKSLAGICGGYLMLFFGVLALYLYADRASRIPTGLTPASITLVMLVEAFVLLLFGSNRVAACIRLDLTSRMIESHRLMPVPAWRAVAGYIFGGGAHALAFALLNMALAVGLGIATSVPVELVLMKHVLLFSFALLLWSVAALATMLARHAYSVMLIIVVFGGFIGVTWAYIALPGFSLLISPMYNETIFVFNSLRAGSYTAFPVGLLAQGGFFAIFFVAACRRYRGTFAQAFPPWLALALLAMWSISSVAGEVLHRDSFLGGLGNDFSGRVFCGWQVIATTLMAMLIALVPLKSLVDGAMARGRTLLLAPASILVAGLIGASVLGVGRLEWEPRWIMAGGAGGFGMAAGPVPVPAFENPVSGEAFLWTGLTAGAFVAGALGLLLMVRRFRPLFQGLIIAGAGLVGWVGPLLVELLLSIASQEQQQFGMVGNFSPIGLLANTWVVDPYYSRVPGMIGQWVVGLGLLAAGWAVARRKGGGKGKEAKALRFPVESAAA